VIVVLFAHEIYYSEDEQCGGRKQIAGRSSLRNFATGYQERKHHNDSHVIGTFVLIAGIVRDLVSKVKTGGCFALIEHSTYKQINVHERLFRGEYSESELFLARSAPPLHSARRLCAACGVQRLDGKHGGNTVKKEGMIANHTKGCLSFLALGKPSNATIPHHCQCYLRIC